MRGRLGSIMRSLLVDSGPLGQQQNCAIRSPTTPSPTKLDTNNKSKLAGQEKKKKKRKHSFDSIFSIGK